MDQDADRRLGDSFRPLRPPLERLERLVARVHEVGAERLPRSAPASTGSTCRADRRPPCSAARNNGHIAPPMLPITTTVWVGAPSGWAGTGRRRPATKPPRATMPVAATAAATSAYSTRDDPGTLGHAGSGDASRRRRSPTSRRSPRPSEPTVAHIVKVGPGETAAAKVLEARINGTPIEALCGHVWVPSRDPRSCRCARRARRSTTCTGSSTTACMTRPPTDAIDLHLREAVRALLLDDDDHVLLVRFEFPTATVWGLPGGGLEPDEEHLAGLRRELREELGLIDVVIGPHVWSREHVIPMIDRPRRPARPDLPRAHAAVRSGAGDRVGGDARRVRARDPLVVARRDRRDHGVDACCSCRGAWRRSPATVASTARRWRRSTPASDQDAAVCATPSVPAGDRGLDAAS